MQLIKDNKKEILKTILIILSIPIIVKIITIIYSLGIYFGTFLRNIIFCS